MPRRNRRKRSAEKREREDSAVGEDLEQVDAMAPPTSDVEMEDVVSGGDASPDEMSEDEQAHEERKVPDRKREKRRPVRGAKSEKSPSPQGVDDEESGDDVAPVATRARTRKRRKQLDTPMQPRSKVRFGVGKNVIARIGRSWKVGWIVDIGSGKVCVRWHTGERRNKGMDDKWVKSTRVHVLSRAQMLALDNGTHSMEQVVRDIEHM